MKQSEKRALEAYPVKMDEMPAGMGGLTLPYDINERSRIKFQQGYEQAEKDLGWHLSTEHPPVDEEVIVLLGRYDDFPQIAFGHIVDQSIAIDHNGWDIPGVKYWMPMPKLPKKDEK